jgi:putative transposase
LRLGSNGWFFVDSGLVEVYKTECTPTGSPFRNGPLHRLADLEEATAAWVHWYNNHRLMHRLGRRPPVEYEALYHAKTRDGQPADHT